MVSIDSPLIDHVQPTHAVAWALNYYEDYPGLPSISERECQDRQTHDMECEACERFANEIDNHFQALCDEVLNSNPAYARRGISDEAMGPIIDATIAFAEIYHREYIAPLAQQATAAA